MRKQACADSRACSGSFTSASHNRPRLPNKSVTGERSPCWCSTACTWFFSRVRCRTSVVRNRTCCRRACVSRSAFHDSGNKSQRNKCASVAESTRSFFNFADAIAFTRCGCTSTNRFTSGSTTSRNPGQNPQASTPTCTSRPRYCRKYFRNAPFCSSPAPPARSCLLHPAPSCNKISDEDLLLRGSSRASFRACASSTYSTLGGTPFPLSLHLSEGRSSQRELLA